MQRRIRKSNTKENNAPIRTNPEEFTNTMKNTSHRSKADAIYNKRINKKGSMILKDEYLTNPFN
jgi:hypothetical protein